MAVHVPIRLEYIRYGRGLPEMPTPVEGNGVPIMPSVVGAFGLVRVQLKRVTGHQDTSHIGGGYAEAGNDFEKARRAG